MLDDSCDKTIDAWIRTGGCQGPILKYPASFFDDMRS